MKYFSFDIDFYIDKLKHGKSSKPWYWFLNGTHYLFGIKKKKKEEEDEMTYVLLIWTIFFLKLLFSIALN